MATYNQFVVTDAGRALLAKAIANKGTFTVSSIKTSSHTYTQSAIANLTSLDDIRQSFPLASAATVDSTTIKLEFNVTNVGLAASYTLATLGVYATYNNSETLFAVSTANNPDVMNAEQAGALVRNILTTVYIKTSNASSISIAVAMDTYVTKAMLDAAETKALDRAHPIGSVYLNIGGTDPATAFGGTWKKIEGSYLLASGSYDGVTLSAGKTVGEARHTITGNEMPRHHHEGETDINGNHCHGSMGKIINTAQDHLASMITILTTAAQMVTSTMIIVSTTHRQTAPTPTTLRRAMQAAVAPCASCHLLPSSMPGIAQHEEVTRYVKFFERLRADDSWRKADGRRRSRQTHAQADKDAAWQWAGKYHRRLCHTIDAFCTTEHDGHHEHHDRGCRRCAHMPTHCIPGK